MRFQRFGSQFNGWMEVEVSTSVVIMLTGGKWQQITATALVGGVFFFLQGVSFGTRFP